ncbi:hypothetical protein QCA50_004245 [Cerrena zonata]|uniref:Glycopeptide n=1 Tax=Cerrena zonata TaxID=2478898 RepID=A0AAW0GQW2_9APHY
MISTFTRITLSFLLFTVVYAEQHTVRFENHCGSGTPTLIQGANTLSTGQDYTSNGTFSSAIAYLQTGACGFNGENCSLVEMTLGNSHCVGCGSSVDISLIPPHAFNVETSFSFIDGCDGSGATCATKDCKTAFFKFDDNQVQVACQTDNVGLLITFCGSKASSSTQVSAASTAKHVSTAVNSRTPSSTTNAASISHSASSALVTSTPTPPKCNRKHRRSVSDSRRRHHARTGHGGLF